MNDTNTTKNNRPLHELIGDLSEGILSCSYNEDHIRLMWNEGQINQAVKDLSQWEKPRFDSLLSGWEVVNEDYQTLLTQKVVEAGGWAPNWSSLPEDLSALTEQELRLIRAWLDAGYGDDRMRASVIVIDTTSMIADPSGDATIIAAFADRPDTIAGLDAIFGPDKQ